MRSISALTLLLISGNHVAATDTCAAFKEDGECYDTKNFYVTGGTINATRAIVKASKDATAASVFDQFIEPFVDIAMMAGTLDLETEAFCYGSFEGEKLKDSEEMDGLGCDNLPLKATNNYGTVAGKMAIPPVLQGALTPLSLWSTITQDILTPSFCLALRVPTDTCHTLTFGASLNKDAVATLNEVMPAGGVGQTLLALISAMGGVDPFTIAFSFGEGLDATAKYFTNRKFIKENFHAHLDFSAKGPIDLPFITDTKHAKSILKIEGPYQRAFHMGESTSDVASALASLLDPAKLSPTTDKSAVLGHVESTVGQYPELIATEGDLTVDLNDVTRGLFGSFKVSGASIRALKLKNKVGALHPGFYMQARVPMDSLKEIAGSVCDKFEGAILAVSNTGCPDLESDNEDGALGLEIRAETLEILMEWSAFFLRCKVHAMEEENPRMNCQLNDIVFGITGDEKGFSIGKSHAITGTIEELVSVVSKDAVKKAGGFKKDSVVTSRLSSGAVPKAFEPVAKFFGGQADDARASVGFGFLPDHKCKSTTRLWSSRDKSRYKHHFSQAGFDDTRASCFLSCYEWHVANAGYKAADLCCSFETLHDSTECRVGHKGQEKASDNRKSASITFVEDFERLRDLSIAGGKCEKGEECFSGYCDNGVCTHECASDNKCFASLFSKCSSDDACLGVNGARHFCDKDTGSCACDESSGRCIQPLHEEKKLGLTKVTEAN